VKIFLARDNKENLLGKSSKKITLYNHNCILEKNSTQMKISLLPIKRSLRNKANSFKMKVILQFKDIFLYLNVCILENKINVNKPNHRHHNGCKTLLIEFYIFLFRYLNESK
jgi:hypothetical protein